MAQLPASESSSKAFSSAAVYSTMTQDYLKVIYSACERGGDGLSINNLAVHMGVVASTASENVKRLSELGLVLHKPYQRVHLTERGLEIAVAVVRRHRLLETYLFEKLDFGWDEVHREAEILEHAISDVLLEHLDRALGYPMNDPHGDPIPAADGTWFAPEIVSLDLYPLHKSTRVTRLSDSHSDMLRYLREKNILPETSLEVIKRNEAVGMTTVKITPPGGFSKVVDITDMAAHAVFVAANEDSEPIEHGRFTSHLNSE